MAGWPPPAGALLMNTRKMETGPRVVPVSLADRTGPFAITREESYEPERLLPRDHGAGSRD